MKNEKNIYEMSPEELNDKYQEVILKHTEAQEAYELMRKGGDKKTKKSNWLIFENNYPANPDEKEKVAFLNLMKDLVDSKTETKESLGEEINEKGADGSKFTTMMAAFESAYPDFKRGNLPKTPAKRAYERYKRHFSDYVDTKLVEECETVIMNSPDGAEYCFHVANLRNEAWPDAEGKIADSPWWSYMYAKMVLKDRFVDGEEVIATSGYYSYLYAHFVLKGRFVEGEQAISEDARASLNYAQKVIGGRFKLGEAAILQAEDIANEHASEPKLADEYRKSFIKGDVPFSWHSNNTEVGDES